MRALVTGANGFIGSHLCELLKEKGEYVRGMVRRTSDLTWINGLDIELAYGDLRDRDSLERAVVGMDWVFHTAATVRPRDPADYERVNYEGTKVFANMCADAGVGRFVFFSSAAAAGPALGADRPKTETDKVCPVSQYGKGKLKAEQAILEIKDRLHSVILRLSAVYGPRDRDNLILLRNLKHGIRTVFGGTFSVVYVKDAVRAALLAAERDVVSGSVFFVADGCFYTYDDIARVAEELLDRRTVRVRIPNWVLKTAGCVSERFSRGSIFNRDKAKELSQGCWVCSSNKAKKELGFEPEYRLERGLEETVRWYQERKWL
ncbi:hypothetical protein CH330_00150 [candidate division WOR-3 bacterium JGI_Cruoil_03_51_56]|uniref:NAD-dependent epimerase/dehydratase domain-containing protein n=1 Tax=candidate division WOR-3 bacterium JGI_Cruoil_03_51_56 TaxID=1973747 RepID=A0A235C0T2_UNCW3|nr:MAG: hypothetical protein CH330_00150 [candidate division WOR-3 bacterium JGI_Cruoil_03_51_56]